MKSRPASQQFGEEFYDVDLENITEQELATVQSSLHEHGVVFFRQDSIGTPLLTPEQHLRFSQRLGPIVRNPFFETVKGYDEIAVVRKKPRHSTVVGGNWHTDHSYEKAPAKGSILLARQVPSSGGNTLFANMYMAFEALPDNLKPLLENLRAVHSIAHKFKAAVEVAKDDRFPNGSVADVSTAVHPVVLVHPESKRKALFVNPDLTIHFEGWTAEQSQPLLQYLFRHSLRKEFVMSFQWQVGSIAFWDNRATMHCAMNDYPNETRIMHRVTLSGCQLHGPRDNEEHSRSDEVFHVGSTKTREAYQLLIKDALVAPAILS